MRIAVNTRFLLQGRLEGVGWFTYQVLRRLVRDHPEQEFIFFFDRPYSSDFIFGENVEAVVLFPPARHVALFVWWFEWSVVRALKEYKADVFLSPDNFCSLRTAVPTVLVLHDLAFLHYPQQLRWRDLQYYRFFTPRFLRKAQRIVTVSQFTKQDVIQHYSIPAEKIAVACNGSRDIFQPLSIEIKAQVRQRYAEGQAYFFYIGAVHPRKNVHRLIEAFDLFKKETALPTKLLIGGRFGWQTGVVKTAYEQASYQDDIVFLDYVSDAELPNLMGAAQALVYVSLFEGFGVPLLEAMHCDVPILTSHASSLPEVAGDAALLVNPESVEEIAQAMEQLAVNESLRQGLIAKGRQQREKFSWEKAAAVVWKNILHSSGAK